MKRKMSNKWREEIRKSRPSYIPEEPEEMIEEDHALEKLLMGLRLNLRGGDGKVKEHQIPFPLFLYAPAMQMYFDWLQAQVTESGNVEAAKRLYYLAVFAIKTLDTCAANRPEFFQPIAKHQLVWPSFTGWGADIEKMNKKMMKDLNLGEAAPLNIARHGSKSFSLSDSKGTYIAYAIWRMLEFFRREEQQIENEAFACSLVLPDLPGIHDVRKTGLSDAQIEKLKTLLPLSRQNYLDWWKLGGPVFTKRYGNDFENHKDFSGYWKNRAFKDDPKARAKIRSAIKKQIKQAFRSIAPK
jgi:hypothetical protein